MFRETIGKICENPICELKSQMQEAGMPICPECGGPLKPVTRFRYLAAFVAAASGLLVLSLSSAFVYGMGVERLTAGQVAKWITGRLSLADRIQPQGSPSLWLQGEVQWEFKNHREPPDFTRQFLCEERGAATWCRPRFVSESGDRLHFTLSPKSGQSLYVFYRDADESLRLYPQHDLQPVASAIPIRVPGRGELRLDGGNATETFVLILSRFSRPELMRLPDGPFPQSALDSAVRLLRNQQDCLILYVEIPHR